MVPRILSIVLLATPQLALPAAPGELDLWIRVFIPDPKHSGKATGFIVDLPNVASKSVVRLLPTDKINPDCFATDHRSFSSEQNASARLETKFTIRTQSLAAATIEPSANRTSATSTTKVDCKTGTTVDQQPGRVDRDHIGVPAIADGAIQVIGQAQGTNVIPLAGHGPSIDYSFDITWKPLHGTLTAAITYGTFPATEVYAKSGKGSWTPILQRLPDGSPWNLLLDSLGLGSQREVQTIQLNPIDGNWTTRDPEKRFSIEFSKDAAKWTERNAATGASLTREVSVIKSPDGTLRIERPNDSEVLTFLGFQQNLRTEIIARGPKASFIVISINSGALHADWNGLIVTKDSNAHLKDLIQPGSRPAKSFELSQVN